MTKSNLTLSLTMGRLFLSHRFQIFPNMIHVRWVVISNVYTRISTVIWHPSLTYILNRKGGCKMHSLFTVDHLFELTTTFLSFVLNWKLRNHFIYIKAIMILKLITYMPVHLSTLVMFTFSSAYLAQIPLVADRSWPNPIWSMSGADWSPLYTTNTYSPTSNMLE